MKWEFWCAIWTNKLLILRIWASILYNMRGGDPFVQGTDAHKQDEHENFTIVIPWRKMTISDFAFLVRWLVNILQTKNFFHDVGQFEKWRHILTLIIKSLVYPSFKFLYLEHKILTWKFWYVNSDTCFFYKHNVYKHTQLQFCRKNKRILSIFTSLWSFC